MANYENAIEIKGLTKKYDGFTLDNISFNVPKGSIMGFIGQNGAGKTTTIRALLGIIRFDSGSINMLGLDNREHEYEIKEQIAAVFDELPFQEMFNAKQLSIMMGGIYREIPIGGKDGWHNPMLRLVNYSSRFFQFSHKS